ncbi:transposase [Streptomyces fimicarius]
MTGAYICRITDSARSCLAWSPPSYAATTSCGAAMPPKVSCIPLKGITTAAKVNDVTQTLALVDGILPAAGRPGRPRRRPDALLGDKGYDSNPNRNALRKRRILPVISRKGCPNIKGTGKLRYVVEQTFALLHHF